MHTRLSLQFYMEVEGTKGKFLLLQLMEQENSIPFGYYTVSELLTHGQVEEMNMMLSQIRKYQNPDYDQDRTDTQIGYLKGLLPDLVARSFGEEVARGVQESLVEVGKFYEVQLPPSEISDTEIHFIFYMSVPRGIISNIPEEDRHRYMEIHARDFTNIRTFVEAFDPMPKLEPNAA